MNKIKRFFLALFSNPFVSFMEKAEQSRNGVFKFSYQKHLEYKRKVRIFSASSVLFVILSVVVVNIITTILHYNEAQPVFAAATFTVDDTGDASDANAGNGVCATAGGVCTLRAAVEESNALGGANTINFSVSGTIEIAAVISITNGRTTINGGTNHDVVINGSGSGSTNHSCLVISNSADNIIKGLVLQNCKYGINITGASAAGNRIENNYIGTNAAGDAAVANYRGLQIDSGAQLNVIGTNGDGSNDDQEGNVISGSVTSGMYIIGAGVDSNVVAGNYIGLNAAGTAAITNGAEGLSIRSTAQSNIIGTNGDGISDSDERNIISGNTTIGLIIITSNNNRVAGNYIGLNAAGTAAITNGAEGLSIRTSAQSNVVGTNGDGQGDASEGNVISGNTSVGVVISSNSNSIAGNYIGLNAAGTAAIANSIGIYIYAAAQSTTVGTDGDGTSDANERNIVSGNTTDGIYISDASTSSNTVKGNYIGTAADGTSDLGNGRHGIRIDDTATGNAIGGTTAGEPNIIAYNGDATGEDGISIEDDGTDNNKVTRNSIYNNQTLGIDLVDSSNANIAAPVISSGADGGASATIALSGTCPVDAGGVTIELFESDGSGQGQTYITSATSTNGSWSADITGSYTAVGAKIVATATDSSNNTSEFSSEYTILDLSAAADATGSDASVNEEAIADLSGTASYDPNSGDAVTYLWERTAGESVVINNSTSVDANFTAPEITGPDSSVTIQLTVGGGDTDSVVVAITNVNDAPILDSSIPDQALTEDASENAKFDLDDYFSDTVPGGDSLTYSAINNLDSSLGTMDVNANGTVDFNLAANANGSDTVQFRATDTLSATADSNAITITVNSANDAPTFSGAIDNQSTNEDVNIANAFDLDNYFSDLDGDALTYSIVNDFSLGTMTINSNNTVDFDLTSQANGSDTIKFRATDASNETVDSNLVVVTINNINDNPTLSSSIPDQTLNEDASENSKFDLDDYFSDLDGDALAYSVVNDFSLGTMTISADNTVDFDLTSQANGSDAIKFRATDASSETVDSNAVTIAVNPVNDAPTAQTGADQTISEDEETITLDFTGSSDIDGDSLTYTNTEILDSGDGCSVSSLTSSQPVIAVQNKESGYACEYRLIVNDGTVDSGAETIVINVTADNDAPNLIDIEDKTVAETETLTFAVGANDIDTSSLAMGALDSNNDFSERGIELDSLFVDNGNNTGAFAWLTDDDDAGTYMTTFQASDGENNSTQIINLTVIDALEEETTIDDLGYLESSESGPGVVILYDNDNQEICTIDAWPTGGAIGKTVKLQEEYYISVVKNRSGSTVHLYDLNCQVMEKKRLSFRLHPRQMAVGDFINGSSSQEVALSSKRNGTAHVKIFHYNVNKDKWNLLRYKEFKRVPDDYILEATAKNNIIIKKNNRILYKWKFNKL